MSEISVIVPVYRAEKTISRCIDSILVQDFTDFELIKQEGFFLLSTKHGLDQLK